MGPIGMQEMIFIVVLALLLFGPKKLPELARMLGKGMSEFRRAKNELKNTFDTHLQELERETRMEDLKKNPAVSAPYTPYSYVADEHGRRADYDYGSSTYPSEPPVEPHAALTEPVAGTIPRSSSIAAPEPEPAKDEHHV